MSKDLTNIQVMLNRYHSRIEEIREQEEIDPLCFMEQIELDIQLSTGGPADGFKIYLDKTTREVQSACYYYSDWGWYEETWLRPAELDMVVEYFGIM